MKRLVAFLLAFTAALCVVLVPSQPAAAEEGGAIDFIGETACYAVGGGLIGPLIGEDDMCDKAGDKLEKAVSDAWDAVWDSLLGDIITASKDASKWMLKQTIVLVLLGPSLDLMETGLFGENATLAGMLVWVGWVLAAVLLMWQLGRMAVTGQTKYAGQALMGWVQNALLTGAGLSIIAALLTLGDKMTEGLINKSFEGDQGGADHVVDVLLPDSVKNPITMLGVVAVVLLFGFIQMVLVFLRQSAIPIQCLLLPIAGAGRLGGDTTRQWAPKLITSILVVIAYKPILAIIWCAGFGQFTNATGLTAWLRGLATLLLAIIAPAPLTKLFAPLGAEVGAGLAAGGALGAAASVGSMVGGGGSSGGASGGSGGGSDQPDSALDQARRLEQTMPKSSEGKDGEGASGGDGRGGDALAQASRTQAAAADTPKPDGATGTGTAEAEGAGAGGAGGTGRGAGAASAGLAIQVLDGVSGAAKGAANEMGNGGPSS